MSINLDQSSVVIIVFTVPGCGACENYKPRFQQIAQRYAQHVPVIMANANDPKYQDLANKYNVDNVPATFVLRKPSGLIRVEGAIPDNQIIWLFEVALREQR